ncbi:DUF6283 family protein [Ralstonia pseudosolanacearum]|uniref:DUF6283 family protein n=1 Tax=Ralstonia pseudosolanacearum TaxID=1310165 RepID=UPI003CF410FB
MTGKAEKGTKATQVVAVRRADENHQVVTVKTDHRGYWKKPCPDCPWRKDAVGGFPAEAFRLSANTAYDMSTHIFSCHSSGSLKPAACAGFLLRGADHNLSVRLGKMNGTIKDNVSDGGVELFADYREMAVANGVDPNDPVLTLCRDNRS